MSIMIMVTTTQEVSSNVHRAVVVGFVMASTSALRNNLALKVRQTGILPYFKRTLKTYFFSASVKRH